MKLLVHFNIILTTIELGINKLFTFVMAISLGYFKNATTNQLKSELRHYLDRIIIYNSNLENKCMLWITSLTTSKLTSSTLELPCLLSSKLPNNS